MKLVASSRQNGCHKSEQWQKNSQKGTKPLENKLTKTYLPLYIVLGSLNRK